MLHLYLVFDVAWRYPPKGHASNPHYAEEIGVLMRAEWGEAKSLQRSLPESFLNIVARGRRTMAMWQDYQVANEVTAAIAAGSSRIEAFHMHEGVSHNALAAAVDISLERLLRIEEVQSRPTTNFSTSATR